MVNTHRAYLVLGSACALTSLGLFFWWLFTPDNPNPPAAVSVIPTRDDGFAVNVIARFLILVPPSRLFLRGPARVRTVDF